MKKILLILASVAMLSGCMSMSSSASGMPQKDGNYSIKNTEKSGLAWWAYVAYKGNAYLKGEEDTRAKAELRDSDYSAIPEEGIVIIQLNSHDIDISKGENSTYILKDNTGKEVFRGAGDTKIPDHSTSQYGTRWYAYDVIMVDEVVEYPLTIRVVNKFFPENIYEYQIIKNM